MDEGKERRVVRRTLSMMLGGQVDLLLEKVLAGWRDKVLELRQEQVLVRLCEENFLREI